MKALEMNQMENLEGGQSACEELKEEIAILGLTFGIAASFGPLGLAIAGPAALGLGIAGVACAFQD